MSVLRQLIIPIIIAMLLASCASTNPSVLFRETANYQFDKFVTGPDSLYRLAANDIIRVRILANDGENLINVTGDVDNGSANSESQFGGLPILIEYDGTAKLPLVGRTHLAGLTRREAEDKLEALYSADYRNPFVTISLDNRKVIVFPGTGNNAKVVNFTGDNMNLVEALAEVGGISNTGRAKKVKLIRGNLKNPKVYKIDLSTLNGMKEADLALQSGDIIYVDPYEDPAATFSKSVLPWFTGVGTIASVITTVAIVISILK